jgi:hypothetical protein
MEVSDVRRQVMMTIERARRNAADRKTRNDQAAGDYAVFLERIAVPVFRQVAGVLKPEGFAFRVFTPGGSVRLMSESRSDDYIELSLDNTGAQPMVMGSTRIARGHRILSSERPVADKPIAQLTDEDVLTFIVSELEAFVRP